MLILWRSSALSERPDIALIDAAQIPDGIPPAQRGANSWQIAARAKVDGPMRDLAVSPVAAFGSTSRHYTGRKYSLVEVDYGTMPIVRPDLNQTSFASKLMLVALWTPPNA